MSQFITIQGVYLVTSCFRQLRFIHLFTLISVGQCGNQIGSTFWPLALHEYGIQTTNTGMNLLRTQRNRVKNMNDLSAAFDSFFIIPDNSQNSCFKSVTDLKDAKVKARVCTIYTRNIYIYIVCFPFYLFCKASE